MFAEERKLKILELLDNDGSVKLTDLMSYFNVSEATIRRDLSDLEEQGKLYRTHGGAIQIGLSSFETDYLESNNINIVEKKYIAKICSDIIKDKETIFLDSGTTTVEIAKLVKNTKDISIITNSSAIIADFVENGNGKVRYCLSTGGIIRNNFQAFVGTQAEECVKNYLPDRTFISANGFSLKNGATTPDLQECSIKKAMVDNAKKLYLVVDSSKYGVDYLSRIAPLKKFEAIITDNKISKEALEILSKENIKVIK